MKINKSKLKSMVEKGGPVVPVSIKRKRVDEGQSSIISKPSVPPLKKASTTRHLLPPHHRLQLFKSRKRKLLLSKLPMMVQPFVRVMGWRQKEPRPQLLSLTFKSMPTLRLKTFPSSWFTLL